MQEVEAAQENLSSAQLYSFRLEHIVCLLAGEGQLAEHVN